MSNEALILSKSVVLQLSVVEKIDNQQSKIRVYKLFTIQTAIHQ